MSIQREVRVPVTVLLLIQLVTGLGAMAMLSRMAPEIGRIVDENGRSARAAEQMLSTLAEPGTLLSDDVMRFDDAFDVARANITEPNEQPILDRIAAQRAAALDGDAVSRSAVVAALVELAEVNHDSMLRADRRAARLGEAGAWAVALLTILAAVASIAVLRRLHARIVLPVSELMLASRAQARGDIFRRARIGDVADELVEVAAAFNRFRDAPAARGPVDRRRSSIEGEAREVDGNALVDLFEGPSLILDSQGELLNANEAGMDYLATEEGPVWRQAVTAFLRERAENAERDTARLPDRTAYARVGSGRFVVRRTLAGPHEADR
jgi:hypothetical protein